MSEEQFVEPETDEKRIDKPVRSEIAVPHEDERPPQPEPEDDSWLYECSVTAD